MAAEWRNKCRKKIINRYKSIVGRQRRHQRSEMESNYVMVEAIMNELRSTRQQTEWCDLYDRCTFKNKQDIDNADINLSSNNNIINNNKNNENNNNDTKINQDSFKTANDAIKCLRRIILNVLSHRFPAEEDTTSSNINDISDCKDVHYPDFNLFSSSSSQSSFQDKRNRKDMRMPMLLKRPGMNLEHLKNLNKVAVAPFNSTFLATNHNSKTTAYVINPTTSSLYFKDNLLTSSLPNEIKYNEKKINSKDVDKNINSSTDSNNKLKARKHILSSQQNNSASKSFDTSVKSSAEHHDGQERTQTILGRSVSMMRLAKSLSNLKTNINGFSKSAIAPLVQDGDDDVIHNNDDVDEYKNNNNNNNDVNEYEHEA
ncbi:hypothetical protein HELRODRAFT_183906 [Helobdella robusta]|uniref:Uncharacterized protein n=1 Tax=Helobdella robusta TaxID=6412 RepID=T1FKA7_HELRO|nr:hypothetical protein HELRODRAFT_183906 [Helobdella robusta]ESO09759.1 hypothetical protein HELRODRAFT_183906 [Helobdella robusta]